MLILIVTTLCTISAAFTLNASISPVSLTQAEKEWIRGGACKDCVAEWVGQSDLLGGKTECSHGPETDANDCITDPNDNCYSLDCSEYGDPNHRCYDADCECFKCDHDANVAPCEELIEIWIAWCGGDSNETTASSWCDCETEDANDGDNYRWKSQTVIGGGNCSYDPNLVTTYLCGMSGSNAMLACATNSCQPTGDWITRQGSRKKCK